MIVGYIHWYRHVSYSIIQILKHRSAAATGRWGQQRCQFAYACNIQCTVEGLYHVIYNIREVLEGRDAAPKERYGERLKIHVLC